MASSRCVHAEGQDGCPGPDHDEVPATLESQDEVIARIHEAAKYVDLDDCTLSPQCGFASTFQGNSLTPDEQKRKLELVVSTARKVWG